MQFLIGFAIVSGMIWWAIEEPKFRKALYITGGTLLSVLALLVALTLMHSWK